MERAKRILVAGVCIGIPLLFVKIIFRIPDAVFWRYYWSCGGVVIVGMAAFNFCYNRRYLKKMQVVSQLLKNDRPEEYIAEVEALRRRAKGRFANNMLTINLSAGYCELKQYDKAVELLERLSGARLPNALKVVQSLNLCLCYFYQEQTDRAMRLYEDSQKILSLYRNSKIYGGNIAILDIFAAIGANDRARAEEMLQTARNTWSESQFLEDYRMLEERLASMDQSPLSESRPIQMQE